MDFLELSKRRFSSRKFKDKPVEREKIKKVLEAARVAPSAVNKQPWHFVVITREDKRKEITDCYHREWFDAAPVVIVACVDHNQSWKRGEDNKDHADIDISIAIDHLTLAAADLGLSTCWICNFYVEKTKETLQLPENIEPVAMLPLAYPADTADPNRHNTKRKAFDEIVHWEEF